MNDILDKLVIRLLFVLFICTAFFIYKYLHLIFYPSTKKQVFELKNLDTNPADIIHFFSRIIGLSLIFTAIEFKEYQGILICSLNFFVLGIISIIIYLISILLIESILFYNFLYEDEIKTRKNIPYAIISFSNAISLALLVKKILIESERSLIILIILWLYILTMFGLFTKLYEKVSEFNFNKNIIQKKYSLALSYSGYVYGFTIILLEAFNEVHTNVGQYISGVFLKSLLALLIFPIFWKALKLIFKINLDPEDFDRTSSQHTLSMGIYEMAIFISCSILTSIILGKIYFGTIYPSF